MEYVEIGKKEGAKLECGGQCHGNKGYFMESTVFSDVTNEMRVAQEEVGNFFKGEFKHGDTISSLLKLTYQAFGISCFENGFLFWRKVEFKFGREI